MLINSKTNGRSLTLAVKISLILFMTLLATFLLPLKAQAAETETIITLPWPNKAKRPLPPPFILPQQSRWGCLSCHSSRRLSKVRDGKEVSLFIDPNIIGKSMHKKIACIDCHTDFSYDVHPAETPTDFRRTAGLACAKCHPYQALLYKKSTHGQLAFANKKGKLNGVAVDAPTCSDCHSNHDVKSPRFEPNRSKLRGEVRQGKICAKCHLDRYKSWNDYYHGRAYKNGAKDAPVCWDCHGNHRILPVIDPKSTVNPKNLPKTCGLCHIEPTPIFTSYASLIHNRTEIVESNPFVKMIRLIIPAGGSSEATSSLTDVKPESENTEKSEGLLTRIVHFFFPSSLRPEKQ